MTPPENQPSFYKDKSAFRGKLWERRFNVRGHKDLAKCLYKYKAKYFRDLIKYFKRKHGGVNFYVSAQPDMEKYSNDGEIDERSPYFHSATRRLTDMSQFDELFDAGIAKILKKFEEWVSEGSGWVLKRINSITIKIAKYSPIRGKSYYPHQTKL